MIKINSTETLAQMISLLEHKKAVELQALRQQYNVVYESVKPLNIVKSALDNVISSPDLKHNILNTVVGLASGFISKKLLVGSTKNPLKTILGTVLQFAVTNFVAKRTDI
ncbi:hypothetical protein [Flavobacterium hiemivividum]|uniref:Uncharacterized protein n=1 Tax=Flavobacterium hiemivividum TaxID=2541734 RepID=A0A4R5CR34_9FLAO|nr:hypothetical protein [Flavobacterium hiemivividum]TDE02656.1 hypothetical protein E0F98_12665 [Flavobacterium hiemivividum]